MLNRAFESLAQAIPNNIAIVSNDKTITYDWLNKETNKIARSIYESVGRAKKEENARVALLFEQGTDMIIGSIAAIKAGITYVPIDPAYPVKRLEYMLKHSDASIILTNAKNYNVVYSLSQEIADIEIININDIDNSTSSDNLALDIDENAAAYILYTSGSTGEPKGVIQTYKNVYYFAKHYGTKLDIGVKDKMTLFSAFTHDAAIVDIYSGLLFGATLFPLNVREQIDIAQLSNWLIENQITIWHSVPTLYRYFTSILTGKEEFNKLRYIVLGGENVLQHDINSYRKYFKGSIFVNLYGQSESSINSMQFIHPNSNIDTLGLGEVLEETEMLVVDEEGAEAEILSVGEIVIISDYVALGYWKDEERTNKVFGDDPEVGKTYWTGDLGRLMHDGSIEYMGRKDNQVKIRGYRVELEEIENKLVSYEDIKEAAVVARKDSVGENYICAYIVVGGASKEDNQSTTQIRQYLLKELPEYMVPAYFVQLEKLPLTSSGKVDRKALPEPDIATARDKEYEAPRNNIEEKLDVIWKELLGVKNISINDNFFELGGHSLKAIKLVNLIKKQFNVDVKLQDIFQHNSIARLSKLISNNNKIAYIEIGKAPVKDYYELSYNQKRLLVLNQLNPNSTAYNMFGHISINQFVDVDKATKTLETLLNRHESLRTYIEKLDGEFVQKIEEECKLEINYVDISGYGEVQKRIELDRIFNIKQMHIFDLGQAPLFICELVKLSETQFELIYCMHHIISDGWSLELLKREFETVYEAYSNNIEPHLEPLSIQYKDFAYWQNRQIESSEQMNQAKAFWRKQLQGHICELNLPYKARKSQELSKSGALCRVVIGGEVKEKLKEIAIKHQTSLFTVMLSVFYIYFADLTQQEDIIFGIAGSGRDYNGLENVFGYFVNTVILNNKVDMEDSYSDFLDRINENAINALQYQNYPMELVAEELKIKYPVIDVFINMLNMFDLQGQILEDKQAFHLNNMQDVKFHMEFYLREYADAIEVVCAYAKEYFDPKVVEYALHEYTNLVTMISEDNTKQIIEYFE